MRLLVGFVLLIVVSSFFCESVGCSATVSECGAACHIIAPPGGSASCYTDNGTAYCISYDADLNQVDRDTASCSGGGGAGGGAGGGSQYCAFYWWLCDPWAM